MRDAADRNPAETPDMEFSVSKTGIVVPIVALVITTGFVLGIVFADGPARIVFIVLIVAAAAWWVATLRSLAVFLVAVKVIRGARS